MKIKFDTSSVITLALTLVSLIAFGFVAYDAFKRVF